MKKLILSPFILAILTNHLFAASVESTISSANSWVTSTLGPVILVLGIAVSGVYIVMGNKVGLYKSIWAVAGGAVITLAGSIANLITGWAS